MIAVVPAQMLLAAAIGAALIGACRWIDRRSPRCARVVAAGVLVHSALTLLLFWTSYLNPPFLRHLQSGDGFWSLAVDARVYYHFAFDAVSDGFDSLPLGVPSSAFVRALASWMWAVGSSPMSGGYLNLVLQVLLCVVIVAAFRPTGDRRSDLPCVVMLAAVSFSPALLIYGSQPLKDVMFVVLIGIVCATARVFVPALISTDGASRTSGAAVGAALICLAALYLIAGIRAYYTALAWSALALALVAFSWRARRHLARYVALSLLLLSGAWSVYLLGADADYYVNPYAPILRPLLAHFAPAPARKHDADSMVAFVDHYRTGFVLTPGATNVRAPAAPRGKRQGASGRAAVAVGSSMPAEGSGPSTVTRTGVLPEGGLASRLSAVRLGLALIFVPVSALRALSIVEFGGGRGLLAVTDLDTMFMDLSIVAVLFVMVRGRSTARAQLPYVTFAVALAVSAALLMAYIVTNFGTLFRLRLMVAAPLWMLPLALSTRAGAGVRPGEEGSPVIADPRAATPGAHVRPDLLDVLVCPACARRLEVDRGGAAAMRCSGCALVAPIDAGIPRFVGTAARGSDDAAAQLAARTQASFGYEWTHFHEWRDSGAVNFRDYFETADLSAVRDGRVLDAGCGMGRHARQIAPHARQVVAVDFSRAIDQAAINTRAAGNVDCVQADLLQLPFADLTFDYIYSFGVLHHLVDTDAAVRALVAKLKPGARLRVYVYWKRHGAAGVLLRLVNSIRPLTTRLPFRLLRWLCWLCSVALWAAVVLPYKLLLAAGVHARSSWPLLVYARYPFRVLYNDQFDRFSAPLEKRYDPEEVAALLESAGLRDVRVDACFGWIAEGVKAAGQHPCAE